MAAVAPYGTWISPFVAADLVAASHPVAGGAFVGDEVWWLEARPSEQGRYAVRRAGAEGSIEDVLVAPWNARTRVHEYGGGAWTADDDGTVVFAEFTDQRLYRLDEPGGTPVPLTPEPPTPAAWRYGELQLTRPGEVWCVRERLDADGAVRRDLAAVPLDGSAADDASGVRSVVAGSHFLAGARLSPDGARVAWIAWEHPQMPWDGTELRVAELDADGRCGEHRTLRGSTTESVLQPEWIDNDSLYAISDASGFWNLYRVGLDGAGDAVAPVRADLGGPLWMLGSSWYRILDDGRLLTVRTSGTNTLAILDPANGHYADLDLGDHTSVTLGAVYDGRLLAATGGARTVSGLRSIELATGAVRDVRLAVDDEPDPAFLPNGELMTLQGPEREVHAIVYRPHNPDFTAPDGELPPFVALVHGGPTGQAMPAVQHAVGLIGYFTSRGVGVVDVNYGGSTGYGREYRDRLRGQWGVVDVEDVVAAVRGLAEIGIADPARLGIEGGSAGGWTVLAALTRTDVFACGVSLFGVAELIEFAKDTHDFESRYLDGLVGPLPEAEALYVERAPLSHVDGLSCPVLLLQGLDDPIVLPSQAEMFRDALVAQGLPHAYIPYEGESHGFRRRETLIDVYESSLSFYGQVFGFEPADIPRLELWRP